MGGLVLLDHQCGDLITAPGPSICFRADTTSCLLCSQAKPQVDKDTLHCMVQAPSCLAFSGCNGCTQLEPILVAGWL